MTQQAFFRREMVAAAGVALWLGLLAVPGLAATETAQKAAPAKKQGNTKFLPGSEETRKERATRLKRECKGRVNAGACEGYTQ
ncbi:MAG: hypothetical protein V4711_12995 [Pseudomonadota bacterium]